MTWWQRLRDSFWFVPGLFCLAGVVAAEALVILDAEVDLSLGPLDAVMYRVGAGGARGLLEAIATSVLAAAATSFSITIAVISLASSTYGPRLVRNFMADRGNQVVLGVYLATFLYSLLVLRTVRAEEGDVFVPHAAVAVAVLLAVVSVGVLVYFIHHISDSVQVWTLAQRVRDDLFAAVDHAYPEVEEDSATQEDAAAQHERTGSSRPGAGLPDGDGVPARAPRDGYVASIDTAGLLHLATDRDAVLALRVRPGSFCVRGTEVATVWARTEATELAKRVSRHVVLKEERTPHQDLEFAVQQLIELGVRALSPSTNDPYTALNAFDQLSAALVRMVSRPSASPDRPGPDGTLRLHAPRATPEEAVAMLFEALRTYALDHPVVLRRAVEIADRIGTHARLPAMRRLLVEQLDATVTAYERTGPPPLDLAQLQADLAPVRARLLQSTA